jgi:hypothetical protein
MQSSAMIISKQLTPHIRLDVYAGSDQLNLSLRVKGFDSLRPDQETQCRITVDEARFVMDVLRADCA